jgi:hypothetical protein
MSLAVLMLFHFGKADAKLSWVFRVPRKAGLAGFLSIKIRSHVADTWSSWKWLAAFGALSQCMTSS